MRKLALGRFWLAGGVLLCIAVLTALLVPQSALAPGPGFSDKAQHFLAFAGIAGWFCGVFERRHFLAIAACVAGLGLLSEGLQWAFTHDRHAEVADLVADFAGIGVAIAMARLGLDQWSAWIERRFGLEYRRTD